MPSTDYDAMTDTLRCGCDPDWADHRCMGGRRPSYCSCGAPDDCYCPSPGERLDMYIDYDLVYPVRLLTTHYDYDMPGIPLYSKIWLIPTRNQLLSIILDHDMDDTDMVIYDANNKKEKI